MVIEDKAEGRTFKKDETDCAGDRGGTGVAVRDDTELRPTETSLSLVGGGVKPRRAAISS